jgi:sugar-phosphatase
VIFDFDGLIIDTNSLWTEAEQVCFSKVGVSVTPEKQRLTASMTTRQVARYWHSCQPWGGRSLQQLERDVIQYVRRSLSLDAKPMAGAIEAIGLCVDKGYRIGLATNAPREVCEPALERLGVHQHFDAILTEADVKHGKPYPDVYTACLNALALSPREAIAFEDSPTGAIAARRAGIPVVGLPSTSDYEDEMRVLCHSVLPSLDSVDSEFFETVSASPIKRQRASW